MQRPRTRDEQGFTMLEIVVAISILGIILVTDRLLGQRELPAHRRGARRWSIARRWRASRLATSPRTSRAARPCPVASTTPACGSGTGVINIERDGDTIAYVSQTEAGSTRTTLYRRTCQGTTQTSQHVLGRTNDTFSAFGKRRCDEHTHRELEQSATHLHLARRSEGHLPDRAQHRSPAAPCRREQAPASKPRGR